MQEKGTPCEFKTIDHPHHVNKTFELGSEAASTKRDKAAVL